MSNITLLEKHFDLFNALNPKQTKNLILNLLGENENVLDSVTSLARTTILSDNNELELVVKDLKNKNLKKKLEISEKRRIAGSLGGKKSQENRKQTHEINKQNNELSTILKQNQANLKSYPPNQANSSKTSICFSPTPPFISSQVINKYNNIFSAHLDKCQRASEKTEKERNFLIFIFGDLYKNFPNSVFREAYIEILDTLLEAIYQASTDKGLIFKQKCYKLKDMFEMIQYLDFKDSRLESLMYILRNKEKNNIRNYPFYIFGSLVNASESLKHRIKENMEE